MEYFLPIRKYALNIAISSCSLIPVSSGPRNTGRIPVTSLAPYSEPRELGVENTDPIAEMYRRNYFSELRLLHCLIHTEKSTNFLNLGHLLSLIGVNN